MICFLLAYIAGKILINGYLGIDSLFISDDDDNGLLHENQQPNLTFFSIKKFNHFVSIVWTLMMMPIYNILINFSVRRMG